MTQVVLEKRTSEAITFDVDCTSALATAETISSAGTATADQGTLTLGSVAINGISVTYPDGTVAAIGKVLQVRISAGTIPAVSYLPDGRAGIRCTIRLPYTTSTGNNREATVLLDLTNTPA